MVMKLCSIMKRGSNDKGFTLVELIIVMAILALLAGLAMPKFSSVLSNSKTKAHNANVEMIQRAVDLYATNTDTALADIDDIDDLVDEGYLKEVPDNPMDSGDAYTVEDGKVYPEKE